MLAALERLAGLPAPARVTPADIEALEAVLLQHPQADCPVVHYFGPGVYMRECEMPAGHIVIGHEHTTEHQNIVLSGCARVLVGGTVKTIRAGDVFLSGAGTRKVAIIEQTMRFITIHPNPNNETDPEKLEAVHIRKSDTWLTHQETRALAAANVEVSP